MYALHVDQTNHKAQFSEHLTFERMYVFMETLNLPFRVASKIQSQQGHERSLMIYMRKRFTYMYCFVTGFIKDAKEKTLSNDSSRMHFLIKRKTPQVKLPARWSVLLATDCHCTFQPRCVAQDRTYRFEDLPVNSTSVLSEFI